VIRNDEEKWYQINILRINIVAVLPKRDLKEGGGV